MLQCVTRLNDWEVRLETKIDREREGETEISLNFRFNTFVSHVCIYWLMALCI